MNKKLIILSFVLNVFFGVFMFVFGELDDSPGGQLLGAIAFTVGISGLILAWRKNQLSSLSLP